MRKIALLAGMIAVLGMGAGQAQAQNSIEIGPRIGIDLGDVEELFVGADLRFSTPALPIKINPGFDYYMVDGDVSLWTIDVNALYEFGVNNQMFTPYVGAGFVYSRASVDTGTDLLGDVSDSEVGLGIVGGATFSAGSLKPFVQAKFKLGGDTDLFSVGGGLLFSF